MLRGGIRDSLYGSGLNLLDRSQFGCWDTESVSNLGKQMNGVSRVRRRKIRHSERRSECLIMDRGIQGDEIQQLMLKSLDCKSWKSQVDPTKFVVVIASQCFR